MSSTVEFNDRVIEDPVIEEPIIVIKKEVKKVEPVKAVMRKPSPVKFIRKPSPPKVMA